MKRLYTTIIALAAVLTSMAQTLQITTRDNMVILANADEVGEMFFTSNSLSIGQEVFELDNIAKMEYLTDNFDPQLVSLDYSNGVCKVKMPLALMQLVSVERDGQYATLTSTATADPEIIYNLSGTTSDGAFTLIGEYKCDIQLNGINIKSNKGAAFYIKNGKRIDIETLPSTVNRFEDYAQGEQDACFQVKGHPEFKGSGSIYIAGNAGHAYKSGEYTLLKRSTGLIQVTSATKDAMHIGQYFQMRGGNVVIQNGVKGDGIQVEKSSDPTKEQNGMILLDSGTVNINIASDDVDGIKCDSTFYCNGGKYTITSNGNGSKGISVAHNAIIKALYSTPEFNITANGDNLDIGGDKKKVACFKVDGSMFFHAGKITMSRDGKKGLKIGGDYNYVPAKTTLSPGPYPEVTGSIRIMSE